MDSQSRRPGSVDATRPGALLTSAVSLGLALIATAAAFLSPPAIGLQDPERQDPAKKQDPASMSSAPTTVEVAKAALEKMVETRREIAVARRDWRLGKELLQDRIGLIEREIERYREQITEIEKNISTTDEQQSELTAENESLKAATASLAERIEAIEARLAAVLPRLPDPIREKTKPLTQRLPKEGEEIKSSLGERFAIVLTVLGEIDKFHQGVHVENERRTLSDGNDAVVTSIYFGNSYGFYVNADEDAAGYGFGGPEGWTWHPADEHAKEIARAIAIAENREPADFVLLPVEGVR